MAEIGNRSSLRDMAGLATPMSLRVAATLKLADRIGDAGATADDLAAWSGAATKALTRVLDHLVMVGVFDLSEGYYNNTDLGKQLQDGGDNELLDELDVNSAIGRAELSFVELLHTVSTGAAAYPRRYGRDFWADLAVTPSLQQSFDTKMVRRFREQAPQIAQRFNWSRFRNIIDVGGGRGTVLSAILRAYPDVRGQLIDLPPTAARAAEEFASAGLTSRVSATAGSFFEPLPIGADAYILSDVLHDWDDEHAHAILSRCARAAGPNGTILVIEPVRGRDANTAIDLAMLAFFGGCERTIDELAEMASEPHLALESTTQVAGDRTLLEFTVASTGAPTD